MLIPVLLRQCNQGQPCSNCARRFPQPACEYKQPRHRCVSVPDLRTKRPHEHRRSCLPGGHDSRPSAVVVPQRPSFAVSLSPPALSRNRGFDIEAFRQPPVPQHSPLLSPWGYQRNSQDVGEMLPNWPAFDAFGRSPTTTPTPTSTSTGQYAWTTDQQSLSMSFIACEDGCTAHSDEVHEAIRTLTAYRSNQNQWASSWTQGHSAWSMVPNMSPAAGNIPWPVADPTQELGQMPVPQPMQNAELLSVCKSSFLPGARLCVRGPAC
jgi:hypothetical protein